MKTLQEFRDRVDLYSADLSHWPEADIRPALDFMARDAAAKEYFEAARALDDRLRAYEPPAPRLDALEARIMTEIARAPRPAMPPAQAFAGRAWLFAPGGGLVAAAVIGFLIGFSPAQQADTLLDPVYYAQDQIISGDADMFEGGLMQ
jgi:hypothetical protein